MYFFRDHKAAYILIALGSLSLILGAYRGEIATVLHKSIIICLECIGIG